MHDEKRANKVSDELAKHRRTFVRYLDENETAEILEAISEIERNLPDPEVSNFNEHGFEYFYTLCDRIDSLKIMAHELRTAAESKRLKRDIQDMASMFGVKSGSKAG